MTREQQELMRIAEHIARMGEVLQKILHELAQGHVHAQELAWDFSRAIVTLQHDLRRSAVVFRAVLQPETNPDAGERASAGTPVVVATRASEPGDAGSTPACPPLEGQP